MMSCSTEEFGGSKLRAMIARSLYRPPLWPSLAAEALRNTVYEEGKLVFR